MKRILFYSENFCGDKIKGGLEVATFRIAKALKDSGKWEIYNSFRSKSDGKDKSIYSDVIKLNRNNYKFRKKLTDFIIKNEIDVVVNMSRFYRHDQIVKSVKKTGKDIKIVFMQHFAPGSEMKKPTLSSGIHLLKLNPYNPVYWLRSSIYPLLKLPRKLNFSNVYRQTYLNSDKVVLLSEGYINDYCKIGKLSDTNKFIAIPNIFEPVVTTSSEDKSNKAQTDMDSLVNNKKNRVLILSRMDEIQKRISLSLKIWENIEKDPDLSQWHLDIVGTGHNTDIVKRLIKKYKLKNVTFHGWQDREPFLKSDAILISTSEYEGLPLAILEAQAYGMVPIAFNSYASLKDVVSPFENGVIVENFGDIDDYTRKLTELMYDSTYRKELGRNAILSADRFSEKKITSLWVNMLDSL